MFENKKALWKAVTESLNVGRVSPRSVMDDCHIDYPDAIIALDLAAQCLIGGIGALFDPNTEATDSDLNFVWELYQNYLKQLLALNYQ